MSWSLRGRLRIAVVGLPLALWSCERSPREKKPGPTPVPITQVEHVIDAAIGRVVKPLEYPGCRDAVWCAPPASAKKYARGPEFAAARAACPAQIEFTHPQHDFKFGGAYSVDESAKPQDGGAGECCYYIPTGCVEGRPLLERGRLRVARVVRGTRWSRA